MSPKIWKKVWGRFVVKISTKTLSILSENRFDFQFISRKLIIKSYIVNYYKNSVKKLQCLISDGSLIQ